jgi:hypothetical protein
VIHPEGERQEHHAIHHFHHGRSIDSPGGPGIGRRIVAGYETVALDVDVSPFDNSNTKKEGVSWTYKKVDGYAPIFAYLGEEGYLVHCELREQRRLPAAERAPQGKKVFRRRLRSVIQDLTYLSAKLTRHANRWKLSFWQNSPWGATWRGLYARFCGSSCVRSG